MAFRVELSAAAEPDADGILEWLATQHSGRAGINWYIALQDAIASLSEMPSRCPLAPEDGRLPFELRQLLYGRRHTSTGSCSQSAARRFTFCAFGTHDADD